MTGRRSYLVWAALLAGPAIALAILGLRGIEHEDRIRRREAFDAAQAAVDAELDAVARRLESRRAQEQARPYFEYQARYMPADVEGVGPAFVQSRLEATPGDATSPSLWFRYSFSQDRVSGPDVLPEGLARGARDAFLRAYDDVLRARLVALAASGLPGARVEAVPLGAVAANEELGQLLEEVDVSRRDGRQTAYLDGFSSRVNAPSNAGPSAATVRVRSTDVRFLSVVGASDAAGPALVAWKAIWVPADDAKEWRDAPVDRWLLVGCAFESPLASTLAESPLRIRLGTEVPTGDPAARGRLASRLDVETVGAPDARLALAATPDRGALERARADDRDRRLWTSAGLLGVVGIGLFVLFRSVRREVDMARRKQDFAAAVSHELKTPLAGIRMYADMLKEGWVPEGETTASYAERIVGETKRLSSLVDHVLDLSAFERGVATFRPALGDLGATVVGAAALSAPAATEGCVRLRTEVEPGLPHVSFDPALVTPLVVNLVDNAIKYSAGSETRDVLVRVSREPGAVVLSVADRGVGIPEADRARVFEPFFRSGSEMTRTSRGVGIGLALVARYAQAHAAKIDLSSEVGRGTTVRVRFPAPS